MGASPPPKTTPSERPAGVDEDDRPTVVPDFAPEEWAPSPLLWPFVALLFAVPLAFYVPHHRGSVNVGLASLQPVDVRVVPDGPTQLRQAWALRMASPKDGGLDLAKSLGRPLEERNPVPDLSRLPDPLAPPVQPPPASTPPKKSHAR